MERGPAGRLAWALVALAVGMSVGGLWLQVLIGGSTSALDDLVFVPIFLAFGVVGALVASAQPRNAVGWLFVWASVGVTAAFLSDTYARYSFLVRPDPLPGAAWAGWISTWSWIASFGPVITFLPLLFPDGRLPSPRWRWFARITGAFLALTILGFALQPGPLEGVRVENPVGVDVLSGVSSLLDGLGFMVAAVLALVSAGSLIMRYRRAEEEQRRQIKWFAFAVSLVAAEILVEVVLDGLGISHPVRETVLPAVAFVSLPIAVGIGILRHRLFDIELVINRTVLFGLLAGFVTLMYVGIVVGIGALIGGRGNLLLSIVATALIAVGFQPVRERARHLANRVVYGKRATPYEVLSEFSDRVGGSYSADDVLPRMARVVGEGTGARRAEVWLRVGAELRRAASWPAEDGPEALPIAGSALPDLPGADRTYPVHGGEELLGALSIAKPPGEPLTPAEDTLLADLASQASLILRNVRLVEELRASRQRLVAAQDEERRRLERNIHDGAQQQLVALAVHLKLAQSIAAKKAPEVADLLESVKQQTHQALDDLRDLARGIYPPLLADQGLAVALESQARKAAIPVVVDPDGIGRYPQEAEAAAYFCVLEALQNAAKYAEAGTVRVTLRQENGHLAFTVADDGRGFDPAVTPPGSGLQNMADRLEALGGEIDVRSEPGAGTTVSGRIPVEADGG